MDPRYDVDASGGKGVVVGDYASVVQNFGQAPAPLSTHIRLAEFTALIDERTRTFTGREFVFDAVEQALADPDFPSGYLVLRGEPGIGKTAIVARLVQDHGWVHHFNVAPLGIRSPQAFLANVCAQLIVRYGLDHPTLPAGATEDGGFLSRLLSEAAAVPGALPLVIAVDALDEAEDRGLPPGANRLFLPPDLPAGVHVVVTAREETDLRLFVSARRDIPLRDDDPHNVADIRAHLRQHVDAQLLDPLADRSAGNFMYLVHVLRDLSRGVLTLATVDDVRRLPQGLKDYYRRHWADMRAPDQLRFAQYQQPVLCLLATAREPVSHGQLLTWTRQYWRGQGWDPRALSALGVRDVLASWREFLNEDEDTGGPRYRLYHSSFQDFLADEVGLTEYHDTIGAAALAKIPGFPGAPAE